MCRTSDHSYRSCDVTSLVYKRNDPYCEDISVVGLQEKEEMSDSTSLAIISSQDVTTEPAYVASSYQREGVLPHKEDLGISCSTGSTGTTSVFYT